jgi:peptidoglycan hydrolase-like protein with peptidoglycan-binding domain
MKVLKALLTLLLVLGVVGGAGYAIGVANKQDDAGSVATTRPVVRDGVPPTPRTQPSSSAPTPTAGTPTTGPAAPTTTPSTPKSTPGRHRDVLGPGDTGTKVRDLQARLSQLAWLPETTTGTYDAPTRAAVKGFQAKRGLATSGAVDRPTWHKLVAMTKRPSHDAMFNIWHPGPTLYGQGAKGLDVRALQARLADLDWYFGDITGSYDHQTVTAVKGFQGKRQIPVTGNVDRRTLDRLDAMTMTPSHDAMFNIVASPGALDARCRHGRALCIDKTSRTLRWVVDGKVRLTLDARFGSTLNDTPTREGLFHVYLKDADHVSHMFGSAMPYSMFFSGGQAVHYSSDFAAVGYYGASHGCVNIRDYDGIKWLFSQVRVGDKVVVYWS